MKSFFSVQKTLILYLALLLLGAGCSNSPSKKSGSNLDSSLVKPQKPISDKVLDSILSAEKPKFPEAPYAESVHDGFKAAMQHKYSFMVDIPKNWRAIDKSHITDGYFIQPPDFDSSIDIRVYAEKIIEGFEQAHLEGCTEITELRFLDGEHGVTCINGSEQFFYREQGTKRLAFYVKAPTEWKAKHLDELDLIAKSLRFADVDNNPAL